MPVQVALLGSGRFAKLAYLPAFTRFPSVSLHTIWSRSLSSATSLVADTTALDLPAPAAVHGDEGLTALLANPEIDAVILVLPLTSQPDLVIRCLQAGKHVLSEKPVHKDVKEAMGLIKRYEDEFKGKGLIWRVAENFAHEPILRQAAEILRDPDLGPVLYWQQKQETVMLDASPWHATTWRTIPDYQGGFVLDGGVHQAALLRTVLPSPPTSIVSFSSLHRTHLPPHDTVCAIALPSPSTSTEPHGPVTTLPVAHDTSLIPVQSGTSQPYGQILLTWATPNTTADRSASITTITCVNGTLTIDEKRPEWVVTLKGVGGGKVKDQEWRSGKQGVVVEIEMFGDAVEKVKKGVKVEEENYGEPRGAAWDLAVIEACLTSQGKEVVLADLLAA